MNARGVGIGLGAGVVFTSIAAHLMAIGPLDPPAGPVTETSPSLRELETKIDGLQDLILNGFTPHGDVEVIYLESGEPAALEAVQVTSEPTRILGISGFLSQAVVFDGPGSFTGSANGAATGDVLGRLSRDQIQVIGSGRGQSFVNRVSTGYPINAVAENGLYLAHSVGGYLIVYYEVLD